jgi:drug/metabolite transporter (DMT)-like permease
MLLRRRPGPAVMVGLAVGLAGALLIAAPSRGEGGSQTRGVLLILLALLGYSVSANLHMPLTQRYGSLPVQVRVQAVGAALTAPLGLWHLRTAEPHPVAVASVLTLGVLGTGLAFVVAGKLFATVGPTRGAIVTYLMPVVALVLGATLRDDPVHAVALVGMALVVAGALITGRSSAH